MWKKIFFAALLLGVGYIGYDAYRNAVFDRPADLPEGAWTIAVRSGFRGMVMGLPKERDARRYLVYPNEKTPEWYLKTWATCRAVTDHERAQYEEHRAREPGHRWEAVCEIDADGETFVRGWIASVPRS